jgi:hypothetical protein
MVALLCAASMHLITNPFKLIVGHGKECRPNRLVTSSPTNWGSAGIGFGLTRIRELFIASWNLSVAAAHRAALRK